MTTDFSGDMLDTQFDVKMSVRDALVLWAALRRTYWRDRQYTYDKLNLDNVYVEKNISELCDTLRGILSSAFHVREDKL